MKSRTQLSSPDQASAGYGQMPPPPFIPFAHRFTRSRELVQLPSQRRQPNVSESTTPSPGIDDAPRQRRKLYRIRTPSLKDIKAPDFFGFSSPSAPAAVPSRIPVPTSSRCSSTSSLEAASRRSSIETHAPMSNRTSSSSISSLVDAPVDPRSPNPNSRLKNDPYLNAVWSLDELAANIPE
ncbi:hypothetical protein AX14_011917, partial [Amanita brunnescens Koide BX004]